VATPLRRECLAAVLKVLSVPTRRSSDLADPVDRRWVDRGDQPDAQRADAQPAALVAHERALDARGQVVHVDACAVEAVAQARTQDRKSTRLNSSHVKISYAVFHLTKKMQ